MRYLHCIWLLAVAIACSGMGPAEPPPEQMQMTLPQAALERRVALVIGNGAYEHAGELANPANDARDIAAALQDANFNVILGVDLTKLELQNRLREFAAVVEDADVALLFYAGHGLQVHGRNYLIPIDAQLANERDLEFEATRLDFILSQMELGREGKTTLVFLDACRDNPLARNLARSMGTRSAALGRGLAQVESGVGTFVSFSTQPGNVAVDGDGRNSPFTAALKRHIRTSGVNLNGTMIRVRKEVIRATGGKQVPWDHSALTGEFYFHPPRGAAVPRANPQPTREAEPAVAQPSGPDVAALERRLRELEASLSQRYGAALPDPTKEVQAAYAVCERLQGNAEKTIRLKAGTRICSDRNGDYAQVLKIVDRAIAFSVNGTQEFTCRAGETCQFNWQASPYFTVRAEADAARGVEPSGELVPR